MTAQLQRGNAAPKFTLPTADGDEVSLDDLRGRKVILYFYPAAMSAGCTKEACDFRDNLGSLRGVGYAVLGVSPDEPDKLVEFREREGLTFPLLADPGGEVHASYGPGERRPLAVGPSSGQSGRLSSSMRMAESRWRCTTCNRLGT